MQESQLVKGVDFIALPQIDYEAGYKFYSETLELPLFKQSEGVYAEFQAENVTLSVLNIEKFPMEFAPIGTAFALHVDDVKEVRKKLEGRGVKFFADTLDTGVCFMAFFADPAGNQLMLHHRYAPQDAKH